MKAPPIDPSARWKRSRNVAWPVALVCVALALTVVAVVSLAGSRLLSATSLVTTLRRRPTRSPAALRRQPAVYSGRLLAGGSTPTGAPAVAWTASVTQKVSIKLSRRVPEETTSGE